MKRKAWEKYQISMDELQDTVKRTVSELKEAAEAGGGLGGAAYSAGKLEEQAAELRELEKKQRAEVDND